MSSYNFANLSAAVFIAFFSWQFAGAQRVFHVRYDAIHRQNPDYQNAPPDAGDVPIVGKPAEPSIEKAWNTLCSKVRNGPNGMYVGSIQIVQSNIYDIYSARAFYGDSVNVIFYDPAYFSQFSAFKFIDIDYLILFSFAHELGHYLNGDVRQHIFGKEAEIRADAMGCKILCDLGRASRDDIKQVILALEGANKSNTHPNKGARMAAIDQFFASGQCAQYAGDNVIKVQGLEWASKNLDVDHYRNGDIIPEAETAQQWKDCETKKMGCWCYLNSDPQRYGTYGKIYNHYAIADLRQLAPYGWHVPSKTEWELANSFFSAKDKPTQKGFYGLKCGHRAQDGTFLGYDYGDWWSSTDYVAGSSWYCDWAYDHTQAMMSFSVSNSGFSVRLIRD